MTQTTKKRRTNYRVATAIHLLLQLGPILFYFCLALGNVNTAVSGVSFTFISLISLGLAVAAAIKGRMSRSSLWLMLIGFYLILDTVMGPLIVIASCQVVDELIARPVRARLREKYHNGKDVEDFLAHEKI